MSFGFALATFYVLNSYPAKIFMGDTGSLALGGFVSCIATFKGNALYIVTVGIMFVRYVISVILQVIYYKATKGKRIFLMSPLHHHFELGGWSETRVVAVFTIVTALLCLVGLMAL